VHKATQQIGECCNTVDQRSRPLTIQRLNFDIPRPTPGNWLSQHVVRAIRLVRTWRQRARGRRQLAQMSEFQLKDIGVSRIDAKREARKPFWRT